MKQNVRTATDSENDYQTVYELEGEPNEVYDARGNPVQLNEQQQQELENS